MPITCFAFILCPRLASTLGKQVVLSDTVAFRLEVFAAGVRHSGHADNVSLAIGAPKAVSSGVDGLDSLLGGPRFGFGCTSSGGCCSQRGDAVAGVVMSRVLCDANNVVRHVRVSPK